MSRIELLRASSVVLLITSIAACGGGGGSAPVSSGATTSKGVITAKGSVFVNGIRYHTGGSAITIDGVAKTENDLQVGMMVKISGSQDDVARIGAATVISADDALEGRIETGSIDPVNKTIRVMGQVVRIEDNVTRLNDDNNQKVFANANFQEGEFVEVHGFPDDRGGLRATRVARKTSGEFEVKGVVTAVAGSSFTLNISPDVVTNSVLTVNMTGTPPAVGSFVEVKSNAAPVGGVITATSVQLEDRLGVAGEKVEVEGIVTSGDVNSFVVNGQTVVTNGSTVFEGGVKADFAPGISVEAEGPLSGNTIVATKISFRSNIRIEANASGVSATGLTVLGKAVVINEFTKKNNFPVVDGDHVIVRANPDRDGNLIATRIDKISASTRAFLQGPVTAANSAAGTLTIVGTSIVTDGQTEYRVSTETTEQAVSRQAFFDRLSLNVTVIKVRWDNFTAVTTPVKQAEIETGK